MTGARTVAAALFGALVGASAVAGMMGAAYSAPAPEAQAVHRVGIVVDSGSGPVSRCVSFAEESISGIEALNRAGLAPVVEGYSGVGGAVCGLNGVGCPADSSCLTCRAPNYWAYYRADNGAGGFAYSAVGAGAIAVTDGDVEGWRWGTGAAPAFRSFDSICPIQPPPTTSTTMPRPGNGTGGTGNGNGSGGGTGGSDNGGGDRGGGVDGPPGQPGTPTTVVGPTTTRAGEGSPQAGGRQTTSSDDDTMLDGDEAAARTPLEEAQGGGGSPRSWLAFVALLAGFGLAGWRIHRIRRRPA